MESKIIVNGVAMTTKEFNAYRKERMANKKKPTPRKHTIYSEVLYAKEYVDSVMKQFRPFNSLIAYQDHAYRQWGTIANLVMGLRQIERPFNKSCVEIRRLRKVFNEIKSCRNKRDLVDLLYQFTWKIDDVDISLKNLLSGIDASEVKWGLMNRECINGKGKRLGLATIAYKVEDAIKNIKEYNEQLLKIASAL